MRTIFFASLTVFLVLNAVPVSRGDGPDEGITVRVPALGTGLFFVPLRNDITEMRVELFNTNSPEIKEFTINKEYFDEIYSFFKHLEVEKDPDCLCPDYGVVTFVTKSGSMKFVLHDTFGKVPKGLSTNGIRLVQKPEAGKDAQPASIETLIRKNYYNQTGHFTFNVPWSTLSIYGIDKRYERPGRTGN